MLLSFTSQSLNIALQKHMIFNNLTQAWLSLALTRLSQVFLSESEQETNFHGVGLRSWQFSALE
jgi:hypothetical protein